MKEDVANALPNQGFCQKNLNPEQYLSSNVPPDKAFAAVTIPDQVNGNLEALDTNMKSIMAFMCLPNMWIGRSPCTMLRQIIWKEYPPLCSTRHAMSQHKNLKHRNII